MSTPRSSAETPLMRQYLEVKEGYPDCLIFFRVGDFYELFFDDAVVAAREIGLTLTTRDKGREDPVPMAGVPHHAVRQYLGRLVEKGFKVAICDQVEDPKLAKGLVRREVTRVVTPGVLLDEEQLDARASWYLAAVSAPEAQPAEDFGSARVAGVVGLAWLDVSTGEFAATEVTEAELDDELARIAPRELLIEAGADGGAGAPASLGGRTRIPITVVKAGTAPEDRALVEDALGAGLREIGIADMPRATSAAAACIRYARATQPTGTLPLAHLVVYRVADHLVLDESTQSHLELFETLAERDRRGSLLGLLDETCTSPGARLLRRWLSAPLVEVAGIRRRHDAVEWLVEQATLRSLLRQELAKISDLERLAGRVTLGVATPRDLAALRRSLERLPGLRASLVDAAGHELAPPELLLLGLAPVDRVADGGCSPNASTVGAGARDVLDDLCGDVAADIAGALIDEPPAQWKEGGFIRRGHHAELDELVDISSGGKDAIVAIELRERERTGIGSLKVRFNKVFGYYIEITRSNLARVPEGYQRKQTLANAERYITDELAEYERKVLGAEERRASLEEELFAALRTRVAEQARRIQMLAEQVALVDVLASLAEVAHTSGYVRPEVDAGGRIEIDDGRHPVVERLAAGHGGYVPNDVRLDPDDAQLLIITGPNMAGKSTVMRQVALISLLGQMGSFVPARRARLGVVDRIFTRVGASDNLSRGESTFMLEMRETAAILRHATRRSLIILDEIGRGTSTFDGLSIAWAVAEYLHDRVGAKSLFATHYHELTALSRSRPRVRNFHVAVRDIPAPSSLASSMGSVPGRTSDAEIVFLHKLVEGGASRSYGIQVARLAGLPRAVLERAGQVLEALERGDRGEEGAPRKGVPASTAPQLSLFVAPVVAAAARPPEEAEVLDRLRGADLDGLSPREAHALLARCHALLTANLPRPRKKG